MSLPLSLGRCYKRLGSLYVLESKQAPSRQPVTLTTKLPFCVGTSCLLLNPPNEDSKLSKVDHSYTDAIHILYSKNAFSFKGAESLKSFSTFVPRQRFEAIQSLKLCIYLPHTQSEAREEYTVLWPIIISISSLCELRIQLAMHRKTPASQWLANEAVWLTPLEDFGSLTTFMLLKNLDLHCCQAYGLEYSRSWSRKHGWNRIR